MIPVLNRDFRIAFVGNTVLRIAEYRLMSSEHGTVLVGVVLVSEAERWEYAIKHDSASVQRWLEKATAQIKPSDYGKDMNGMQMVWAIVDVVGDKPDGFAPHELIRVDTHWLVVRPLAATALLGQNSEGTGVKYDHKVFVRDPSTFQGANTPRLGFAWPWEVYAPVVDEPKPHTPASGN